MEELLKTLVDAIAQQTAAIERQTAIIEQMAIASQPDEKPNLLPLSEAWPELGYRNYRQCWRKIGSHYRVGIEVIDRRSPDSPDPSYWLDVEKCLERDRTIPSRRSA